MGFGEFAVRRRSNSCAADRVNRLPFRYKAPRHQSEPSQPLPECHHGLSVRRPDAVNLARSMNPVQPHSVFAPANVLAIAQQEPTSVFILPPVRSMADLAHARRDQSVLHRPLSPSALSVRRKMAGHCRIPRPTRYRLAAQLLGQLTSPSQAAVKAEMRIQRHRSDPPNADQRRLANGLECTTPGPRLRRAVRGKNQFHGDPCRTGIVREVGWDERSAHHSNLLRTPSQSSKLASVRNGTLRVATTAKTSGRCW
jgi:hypothetical protein